MKTAPDPFSVLIVDDDNDFCELIKSCLPSSLSVHVEHTLTEAGEYLSHHKPSLLFLDNSLPDGKGLLFIKEAIMLDEDIKIIMMTADAGSGIKAEALQQGACYFIPKPFRLSLVKDIVLSIFPIYQRRDFSLPG